MNYGEMFEIWLKETRIDELLKLDAGFFLLWESIIEKYGRDASTLKKESIEGKLTKTIIERMKFLLSDVKRIRKAKIMTTMLNNRYIDSSLLTEEEKKFYRAFSVLEEKVYGKAYKREIDSLKQVSPDSSIIAEAPAEITNYLTVGILVDIPEFIGIDQKIHGNFCAGDVCNLPETHALALVKKNAAFLIETVDDGEKV